MPDATAGGSDANPVEDDSEESTPAVRYPDGEPRGIDTTLTIMRSSLSRGGIRIGLLRAKAQRRAACKAADITIPFQSACSRSISIELCPERALMQLTWPAEVLAWQQSYSPGTGGSCIIHQQPASIGLFQQAGIDHVLGQALCENAPAG